MSERPLETRLEIAPYDFAAAVMLQRELGVSPVLSQVLVRRGFTDPPAARAFLAADERHDPARFDGMQTAVDLILDHVRRGSRITVHGDYDVDGVCSTAIAVRALRRLGASVDWFLPSRLDDGYGLSRATVQTLAARGTGLLVTVDCAITAVEEVAVARRAGIDVVVTDHHRPRADGRLPDAPIVHPVVCGYSCPDLAAAGVALKLAEALEAGAGSGGPRPARPASPPAAEATANDDLDLDLVALATVADCVSLTGENRRLVREGLRALAATAKPGLRALMAVARVDPGAIDARAVSFRLAPRINAAGRLHRADAGLELVLTEDEERAEQVAAELDEANARRRDVETRILFAAERQAAEQARSQRALVLWGEDWHPGVIGIVASRMVERHHRPTVMIALDGTAGNGTGSGRSIPGFDLLGALTACAPHLTRFGGHRAAAGLEVTERALPAFAQAFAEHAAATITDEELVPVDRVDAVAGGDALGMELAEELAALGPLGIGNPAPCLLMAAARFADPVGMGEGRHVRFAVHGGGVHSRAVAFGVTGTRLPCGVPVDATFGLEVNAYNGAVEPRLVLGSARPSQPPAVTVLGEPDGWWAGVEAELDAPLPAAAGLGKTAAPERQPRPVADHHLDRRGRGLAGVLSDLVHAGAPVLVVCADVSRRREGLDGRLGGFALCSWAALERRAQLAAGFAHVVALDPPPRGRQLDELAGDPGFTHLAWGEPELRFSRHTYEQEYGLRAPLAVLYRALRERRGAAGEELEAVLRGEAPKPRSPALAGRLLRVLLELGLVSLDRERPAAGLAAVERTALERSPTFRAYEQLREDAQRYLRTATAAAA